MEFAIPLTGFVFGFAVGRWWAIAAALPFGAFIWVTNPLPGGLAHIIALMLSTLLILAIGSGVALRRIRRRRVR